MEVYFIIVAILFSAFFSGMEIAFLSSSRLRIELEKRKGSFSNRIVQWLVTRPRHYIAAMLVGNNVALVFYGILMADVLEPVLEAYTRNEISLFFLQTLISTILILFTGEFFPKLIFNSNPNFWLTFFSVPVYILFIIMYPLVIVFVAITDFFLKLTAGGKDHAPGIVFGRVDIDDYLNRFSADTEQRNNEKNELKIFRNALDFSNVRIRECVIPRPEMVTVEINDSIENLYRLFIESGYSKILVYRDSIDDITGYVHSKDLLKKPKQIRNILHDVLIVPETMLASHLLGLFIKQKKSVAVVVDEFGGTSGMVAIEDILEEILGEINDEHDTELPEERQVADDCFVFSGRLEIDYLNGKYHFGLPDDEEYETIAGYILSLHRSIPKVNESIETERYIFKILKSTQTRIELIQMKIKNLT
jgi:CBS domain containing-hemolysin-like protein